MDQKKRNMAAPEKVVNFTFESLWKKQAAYRNKDIWSSKKHGPDSSKGALGQPQAVLKSHDGFAVCQKSGPLYLPWVNWFTCPLPTSVLMFIRTSTLHQKKSLKITESKNPQV